MNRLGNHLLALAGLCALLLAVPAQAQVPPFSTIERISAAPRLTGITDGTSNTIATLGLARDGSQAVIVRSFDRRSGFQQGMPLFAFGDGSVRFTDVLVSTVLEPGSVLALDSGRRAHVFPLSFRADGTPFLAAPIRVIGPLGPDDAGLGTVLGEAPNPQDPGNPFLAIGTTGGAVFLLPYIEQDNLVSVRRVMISGRPIQDLGPLSQAGYFAFGAVSGGALFLLHPDADALRPGLQPQLMASLFDPRRVALLDFGAPLLRRDSQPGIGRVSVPIVTANNTTEITTLEIPPNPGFGGALTVRNIELASAPIKQVVFGSLTFLPADGAGVLYNANFNFEDGIVGRLWTISGASAEVAPGRLDPLVKDRVVTVTIEVENNRAAAIIQSSLRLSVSGVKGALSALPSPLLEDADGDRNLDLAVRFNRAAAERLLDQTGGPTVILRARWFYADGTEGTAAAQVRVVR